MSFKKLNFQMNTAQTRWTTVAAVGCISAIAVMMGLWFAKDDPKSDTSPDVTASKHKEVTKNSAAVTNHSLQSRQAESALKGSDLARQFRQLTDADKRIGFLYDKAPQISPSEAFHLLSAAGDDPSSRVRMEALLVLENLENTSYRKDFLAAMTEDRDPSVKDYAFQSISNLGVSERIEILSISVNSLNSGTALRSAQLLGTYRTKSAFEVLLTRCERSDADTEVSKQALNILNHSISQRFSSPEQARNWWNLNKDRHTDDLGLISPP